MVKKRSTGRQAERAADEANQVPSYNGGGSGLDDRWFRVLR